jgi:hypothetical protein
MSVIPAKAGIYNQMIILDPRLRGDDKKSMVGQVAPEALPENDQWQPSIQLVADMALIEAGEAGKLNLK